MSSGARRILAALGARFPDRDIDSGELTVLHRGKFANAIVYRFRLPGLDLVIKDFSHCPAPLRMTLGRLFVRRETKALERLQNIQGVASCHYRLGPYSLLYPFVEGRSLKELAHSGEALPRDFFSQLERLVVRMHQRGVVHLDMRNMGNILRDRDGRPHLIDFQSALSFKRLPRRLQATMRGADLSGVYKSWTRLCEQPVPRFKRTFFDNFGSLRRVWLFKGYPTLSRGVRGCKLLSSSLALILVGVYYLMR